MKVIKTVLWLIILGLLGILIYQNLDYFMTKTGLSLDLKVAGWDWTIPEIQNIAYWGICFLLGLILAGLRGFFAKLSLKKEIKSRDREIASLKEQVNTLKIELDVFQHDPYIKKNLEKKPAPEMSGEDTREGDASDRMD
jgi:hypothetical protein